MVKSGQYAIRFKPVNNMFIFSGADASSKENDAYVNDVNIDDEDNRPSTSRGLRAFYHPPNIDFIAIDEHDEEQNIQDEVAEIRSQLGSISSSEEKRRRLSTISIRQGEIHTV